jgi:hypothetical protein
MEQSPPWEADSSSASQEVPQILCERKVRYRIYISPPSVPVLSQISTVPAPNPAKDPH